LIVLAGVGVIFVGLLALSRLVRQTLTPPPAPTAMPEITESVVVASHDIALGALLKASDILLLEVPLGLAPRDAITDPELVMGKITKSQMVSGEMVLGHNLADPTNINHDLAFVIDDELVLMAFPANDLMSQVNLLQRGDVVDILASVEVEIPQAEGGIESFSPNEEQKEPEKRLYTFAALQRVGVTAIIVDILNNGQPAASASTNVTAGGTPEPTPTPERSNIITQAYLLAVTPQDALVLKHLIDANSRFDFILRNPTSTELFDLSPVMREYLIDRYQLQLDQ
jgi:Flp pilus assembly protein CpaB